MSMIEEEIKKEIRDIINKNKYYFTKKQLSKLLLELVDEIQVIDKDLTCVPPNYDNCIILSDNEQVWCLNMNTILAVDDLVILNDLPITNYFPTIELKIF